MNLRKEMTDAAAAVGRLEIARLRKMGLLNIAVAEMGYRHPPLGVADVVPLDDGLFAFGAGTRQLILPVYEDGELLDLLAVSTSEPDNWRLRTGMGTALGLFDGWHHWGWRDVVPVVRTPLDWLRAGGDALCVTDWSAPDLYRLNDLPAIVTPDTALANKLREVATRHVRTVPIHVQPNNLARKAA